MDDWRQRRMDVLGAPGKGAGRDDSPAGSGKESDLQIPAPVRDGGEPASFLTGSDPGERNSGPGSFTLDTILLYEDKGAALHARRLLGHISGVCPGAPLFNLALWRFDLLAEDAFREAVLDDLPEAPLVLLAAHGTSALPEAVGVWLERWLGRMSGEARALVVLLDEGMRENAQTARMLARLREGASGRNVSLFPRFGDPPPRAGTLPGHDSVFGDQEIRADHRRAPDLNSHWGINE